MHPGPEGLGCLFASVRGITARLLFPAALVLADCAVARDATPTGGGRLEEQALLRILPLTNGLTLGMTWDEVVNRYGSAGAENGGAGSQFRHVAFRDFSVIIDVPSKRVVSIRLGAGVKLAGGVGIGSRWASVQEEFAGLAEGEDPLQLDLLGVRVSFERFGSEVSGIQIRRAEGPKASSTAVKPRALESSRIWPLSNGVAVGSFLDDVVTKLGPPEQDDRRHPSVRSLRYKGIVLLFTTQDGGFHRALLVGTEVKLACGLGVGSSEEEVRRGFPQVREPIVGAPLRYAEPGCEARFLVREGVVEQIELRRL